MCTCTDNAYFLPCLIVSDLKQVLSMLAQSTEFENMQVREEELEELDRLSKDVCEYDVKGGPENRHGKAAILMQVSRSPLG